jgi:hypothetical protein
MRHRLRAVAIASLLVLFSPARALAQAPPPPPPTAPPPSAPPAAPAPKSLDDTLTGEAKSAYDQATQLFDDKDFATAEVKYGRAYELSHDARLLRDMGLCEREQRHYAKAIPLLQRYLAEGGALVTPDRRQETTALIEMLQSFTAELRITVSEPGADVFVDDEKVGTSPLDKPVVVDLGTRRVRVTKAGFKPQERSIAVGGEKTIPVDVKLEALPTTGSLTIDAPAGAAIVVDSRPVGAGHVELTLPGGPHQVRVSAPGMVAYQSDVLVEVGEKRTVGVALQALPAPGPPPEEVWRGALGGMEFAARGGWGSFMNSDHPAMSPLWLEIGVRLGRPTFLGLMARYAPMDASGVCGTDVHGAAPTSPTDIARRFSFSSCTVFGTSLELLVHTMPRTVVDPWFGFDAGIYGLFMNGNDFDPLSPPSQSFNQSFPFLRGGLQLGVDVKPFPHYWRLAFAPFGSLGLAVPFGHFNEDKLLSGQGSNGGPPTSGNNQGGGDSPFPILELGLRVSITL